MNAADVWHRIRRNHAVEHATIAVLGEQGIRGTAGGNATGRGFFIYGDLPTEQVAQAANEALRRLQQGEHGLAISPFCGTNLVVGALLSGLGSLLIGRRQSPWRRLPLVVSTTLGCIMIARPLGGIAQRHLTTSTDLETLRVTRVTRQGCRPWVVHHIAIEQ